MTRPAQYLLPLLSLAAAAWFLSHVQNVLLPFVLAAVMAYVLNPAVKILELRGYRRDRVVLLLYLLGAGLLIGGGYLGIQGLLQEVETFRVNYPRYVMELDRMLLQFEAKAGSLPFADEVFGRLIGGWQASAAGFMDHLPQLAAGIVPLVTLLFLVPFIAFFAMAGGPGGLASLLDLCPSRYVEMALNIMCEIDTSIGNYVRGVIIEAIAVSACALVGLWIIGLNYPLQIALLTGGANMVPYAGPVVGTVAAGIVALIQFKSVNGILAVCAVMAAVQFIDNWILQPVILERAVEMHPIAILFALMAGAEIGGFLGILLAVPAACVVKVCAEIGWEWYRTEFSVRPSAVPPEARKVPVV